MNIPINDIKDVFRRVCPYTLHRWKCVLEKLGLDKTQIGELEKLSYKSRLYDIMYEGLCLWRELKGPHANMDALMEAIRECDLRRAEDELKRINTDCQENRIRPKTSTGTKPRNGTKPTLLRGNTICFGDVRIKISLDKIVQRDSKVLTSKTALNREFTKFYQLIYDNRHSHLQTLRSMLSHKGMLVQKLALESNLFVHVLCSSLGAFETLYQMNQSGRLRAIMSSAFITQKHLQTLRTNHISLVVNLEEDRSEEYRGVFLTRNLDDKGKLHPADDLELPSTSEYEIVPIINEVNETDTLSVELPQWIRRVQYDLCTIESRYKKLELSIDELLRILRIVKPVNLQTVSTLNDVILFFRRTQESITLSSGVRVDLLREYLAIVNLLRLCNEEVQVNEYTIYLNQSISQIDCDTIHSLIQELEHILQPETPFIVEDKSFIKPSSNPEERLFSGFVSFVPNLLCKFLNLFSIIQSKWNNDVQNG
ncbi:hypothetical protein ACJMK2_034280 [Sinanodonta woodiana]|uniref:Death domain-containing protein n=1 Tax=Sinanodonta woodiana TaxID=1069815 RepID=A0ABD3WSV7_SINWO